MKLVHYPDPILDQRLEEVDIENPGFNPVELKNQMVEIMSKNNGLGLSACQVGLNYRLFVMGNKEEASAIVINPTVIEESLETELEFEGCLSFPDVFIKIPRAKSITVEYYDETLTKRTEVINGYAARCFLHELDHLDGVVFKSKVSRLKWDRASKKKDKIQKQRFALASYMNRIKGSVKETEQESSEEVLDLSTYKE